MIDLIASQAPMLNEYAQAARLQWQASRHPQNIEDMRVAVAESDEANNATARAVLAGTAALVGFQATFNESFLSYVGGESIDRYHNIGLTFAAVGGTVAFLDGAIVSGTAYTIDKYRPAVQVAYERYGKPVSDESAEGLKSGEKVKRAVAVTAMAFATGGGSVVGYSDYKDNGNHMKANMKRGLAATGILAVGAGAFGAAVHGGAATAEALGQDNATEATVATLRFGIPAVIAGGIAAYKVGKYWALSHRVNKSIAEANKPEAPVEHLTQKVA